MDPWVSGGYTWSRVLPSFFLPSALVALLVLERSEGSKGPRALGTALWWPPSPRRGALPLLPEL